MVNIIDSTGTSFGAKVDKNNRLHTRAVTETADSQSTINGDGFNISTGLITLSTAGTDNALLYIKNNETPDLRISGIIVGVGTGTYAGQVIVKTKRNPSAGAIVTSNNTVDIIAARNHGSATVLTDSVILKGADTDTFTDGTASGIFFVSNTADRKSIPINLVLPKGSSLGVTVDPNLSSGSASFYVAVVAHLAIVETV